MSVSEYLQIYYAGYLHSYTILDKRVVAGYLQLYYAGYLHFYTKLHKRVVDGYLESYTTLDIRWVAGLDTIMLCQLDIREAYLNNYTILDTFLYYNG